MPVQGYHATVAQLRLRYQLHCMCAGCSCRLQTLPEHRRRTDQQVPRTQVSAEEVCDQLKEAIEYYIDSSTEPHFDQCDDDLYEPLPLDAVDENIGKLVTKHDRPAADEEVGQISAPGSKVQVGWELR